MKQRLTRITELIDDFERKDSIIATTFHLHWALSDYYLSQRAFDKAIAWRPLWPEYGQGLAQSIPHRTLHRGSGKHLPPGIEQGAEAARHLLDDIDWHVAVGQPWQTLGALWSVVNCFASLFGGGPRVVPVLSMAYHHPGAPPYYRESIAPEAPRFKEVEMGAAAYAAAWERGKTLDFDTTIAETRATLLALQDDSL